MIWTPSHQILGRDPRGENKRVAYLYGVRTGQTDHKGREVCAYTVWKMFEPKALIERGKYSKLAQTELVTVPIAIWQFCLEMDEAEIGELHQRRGGVVRTFTFCLEDRGGWKIPCFIHPRQHIGVLLEGRKRCCENPAKGRIFRAFRTLSTFEG